MVTHGQLRCNKFFEVNRVLNVGCQYFFDVDSCVGFFLMNFIFIRVWTQLDPSSTNFEYCSAVDNILLTNLFQLKSKLNCGVFLIVYNRIIV